MVTRGRLKMSYEGFWRNVIGAEISRVVSSATQDILLPLRGRYWLV